MSFSTTADRVTLSGNGSTVDFSFPYILFATADLKVYLKNNTTGAETLQTITTHYTISGTLTNGVYESGVTVTFLTAPTASQTVLILRDRDVTQELDLDENGKIPSTSLEKQLDKFATYIQRVKNKLARSVGLPEGFTASFDPTLPPIMVNDGYLKTTAAGTGLEYVAEQDLINTISTGSQAFTASRALVSDSNGIATVSPTTAAEIVFVNGVTSQLSGNSQAATLQNKTLDNSNIITVRDDRFTIQDNLDTTKQVVFQASALTTATTRTLTLPNANTTIVGTDVSQTLTNKTHSFGIIQDTLSFTDQGSDPSSPASGFKNVYTKSDGMYIKNSAGTVSKISTMLATPITIQRFTSGSGTYTTPAGVVWIKIKIVGGGGGGGGSCTAAAGNGGTGSTGIASTFGTALLTANGGVGGVGTNGGSGGAGGSASVSAPATQIIAVGGGGGDAANSLNTAGFFFVGGGGGNTFFGGAGGGGALATAGNSATANSGGGGGGAGSPSAGTGGCGGGSGGYVEAIIVGPSATYAYAVGSGGGGGAAGTGGFVGGAGGSGVVVVEEYYN